MDEDKLDAIIENVKDQIALEWSYVSSFSFMDKMRWVLSVQRTLDDALRDPASNNSVVERSLVAVAAGSIIMLYLNSTNKVKR